MEDEYKNKKIKAFKECQNDEEIGNLIDKIYENGNEDGYNEAIQELDK